LDTAAPKRGLGAFIGVYTPTVLTILGVIMYLRLGWVTGTVGLGKTLLIIVIANAITLITTLSFSAVATNLRVGVGGAYYIVSRSLGLEIGGAIGLPLFLSQAFSVTLYAFGLSESIRELVWPDMPVQVVTFFIVLAVALLALKGAKIALLTQVPLLIMIGVSLLALTAGALFRPTVMADVEAPVQAAAEPSFWLVFAVFFPAVTGVMAGLGLSGDLREPSQSIPKGALAATLTGFAVYLIVPCLLVLGAEAGALRQDQLVWTKIAPAGAWLILPGLWGAIFSSAVGSILGAPRTLQAMAIDQIAPERLGRGREPVVGLAVTVAIALGAVLLGDLNAVAPVVSMFFLTVYGTINFVAALETISGDPSWRPKIRMPFWVSLLGGFACLGVMLLINPVVALVAVLIELLLWLFLERRELRADWGDARRGGYESLIRWSLVRLAQRPGTARNWRPHVLVFADDVERRLELIRYGSWFSQNRGIVTVCELVTGDVMKEGERSAERREVIADVLHREGILAFPEVDVVHNLVTGIVAVTQANGIAGLQSNTIMLGWPKEAERLADFLRVIRSLEQIQKSAIIGRVGARFDALEGEVPLIHLWWGGMQRNGDLMLLLSHLLTRNPEWRNGRIRLMSIATDEESCEQRESDLGKLIAQARIRAEARVTLLPQQKKVRDVIHEESACADVVFLGLNVPPRGTADAYSHQLVELAEGLRTVFFVKNSSLFQGELL
jgi:solute carrier family 12 (potassium/chloride transporter), member 4/6